MPVEGHAGSRPVVHLTGYVSIWRTLIGSPGLEPARSSTEPVFNWPGMKYNTQMNTDYNFHFFIRFHSVRRQQT